MGYNRVASAVVAAEQLPLGQVQGLIGGAAWISCLRFLIIKAELAVGSGLHDDLHLGSSLHFASLSHSLPHQHVHYNNPYPIHQQS